MVIVHGLEPGPVLAITAGIHGGEYVSMVSVRRFLDGLDPAQLRGTVIASLQSSPQAFAERRAYLNPADGKNLNRSFPGNPTGSPTDRLAHWLWENVISRSGFYIDCHSGDLTEGLDPFVGVFLGPGGTPDPNAVALSECFDVARRIGLSGNGTTIKTATEVGIQAVLIEVGGQGRWTEHEVDIQRDGLHNVIAHLGMTPHRAPRDKRSLPNFDAVPSKLAEHAGLWFPAVTAGETVSAGQFVGAIQDPFGDVLQEVLVSDEAVVAYVMTSLAVNAGDVVVALARPTH
ncbi:succinylglutamate desuccinylase/aspartoacylase family protein [Allobranchiibius sp. GilTou73]|uniref:succinylglutamate desuccinylase/aspartoacylase family protein n=1 Tax=Allobranchiibius sp. GilTou73 TaxID=2904523 RepID=UPI001F1A3F0F|nr:succinylglutamate desuccinylase/aspartoacylase family protein [Allobranchiibius sp. GilTou73]UIJ33760.1 succinylglutamate desuccinylase/aspartoacylase family protein [Allobranchiibius sp. GilTou73]